MTSRSKCRVCGKECKGVFCSKQCKAISRDAFDKQFKGMEITNEIGAARIDCAVKGLKK